MYRYFCLVIFSLALASGHARANSQDWSEPGYTQSFHACLVKAGRDGSAILACEDAETHRQDVLQNAAYQKLHASLSAYQRDLLVKSERAWIEFRDNECAFREAQLIGGPLGIEASAQMHFKAECLLKQTRQRTDALQDIYEGSKPRN
jgi:uncharacterized protein YecT (DUF1311 family)